MYVCLYVFSNLCLIGLSVIVFFILCALLGTNARHIGMRAMVSYVEEVHDGWQAYQTYLQQQESQQEASHLLCLWEPHKS